MMLTLICHNLNKAMIVFAADLGTWRVVNVNLVKPDLTCASGLPDQAPAAADFEVRA